MEELKSSFTIDITNSAQYAWVKTQSYGYSIGILSPEKRSDEYNVLLTLALIQMLKTNRSEYNLLPNLLGTDYLYNIILSYCHYYFLSKDEEIDQDRLQQLKILIDPLVKDYGKYLIKLVKDEVTEYPLFKSVKVFSMGSTEEETIIKDICEKILSVEVITKLEPEMNVCGFSLVECVSKKDNSEVWKASKNGRFNALKIQDSQLEDKFIKKNKNHHEKIIEQIKLTDPEYINYTTLLPMFNNKISYFTIDYFRPLNKKVKIMTWCDGPITKLSIDNKGEAIKNILSILQSLHNEKLCLSNLKPEHIMFDVKENKYILISYSYITKHLGILVHPVNNYSSLFLLSGNTNVTFYDDLESLFYIYDELISGVKKYDSLELQVTYKYDLSIYNGVTKDIILYIRQLKEADKYLTSEISSNEFKEYVNNYYNYIISSFTYFLSQKIELSIINVDLSEIDKARLRKISQYLSSDPIYIPYIQSNPAFVNELAIKILNFMTTGCKYDIQSQTLIENFLLSK